MTSVLPVIALMLLTTQLVGCISDPYIPPAADEAHATLCDRSRPELLNPGKTRIFLLEIDKKPVARGSSPVNADPAMEQNNAEHERSLRLGPGEHLLMIGISQAAWRLFTHVRYARAVLRLEVTQGAPYHVGGDISKKHDYADFWIEDTASGEKVAGPIRVQGLKSL